MTIRPDERQQVAHDLSRLLTRLHEAGWSRPRWATEDWRLGIDSRVHFADWSWLVEVEPADRPEVLLDDVEALQALFRGPGWPPEATRPVTSAAELLAGLAPPLPVQGPPLLRLDEAPFVGRSGDLAALHGLVDAARKGGPVSMTIVGPSGSGKSRLLLHAAERLSAEAVVVRCVRPHVDGLICAFADTFDALDGPRRREVVSRISRQLGDAARELCTFDRRFERWFGNPPPRQRVVREYPRRLTRLVALLAAIGSSRHPLVLLLDRFDEASGAVRALVERLLAEGEAHATAIVRAHTGERPPREGRCLSVLSTAQTEEWLRGTLPGVVDDAPAIVAWLHEQGPSWPAQVAAALQWAVSEGVIAGRHGWRMVEAQPYVRPDSDRLDDETHWLALLMAVEGGRGGVRALRQLSRWPIERLRDRLAVLRRFGFVRNEGNAFAFTSEGIRDAVIAAAAPERRRNAHRAMARYLKRQADVSTSVLVAHEDRGRLDGVDPSIAQHHLRAAEEQLHHLNFERARWHFERAAAWDPDPRVQRRALRGCADALLLTGRSSSALSAYRSALAHARGPEDVLAIAERVGNALVVQAPRSTVTLVDEALGRLGAPVPGSVGGLAWQAVRLGLGLVPPLRPASLRSLGDLHRTLVDLLPKPLVSHAPILWLRGYALARRLRDATGLRHSRIQLARGGVGRLAPAWAHRVLGQALDEAKRSGDTLCEGLAWVGRAELWWPTGQSADVVYALERAIACFEQIDVALQKARAEAALIVHQLYCEPIRTLQARIDALRRTARRQHQQDFGPLLEAMTLWTRVRSGGVAGLALAPTGPARETMVGVWADAIAALAWIELDEVVVAHAYAERAFRGGCQLSADSAGRALALVASAWVGARRGEPFVSQTRRRVRELRRLARRNPSLQAFAWLVQAYRAVGDDDLDGALAAAEHVLPVATLQRQRWLELDARTLLASSFELAAPDKAKLQRARADEMRSELVEFPLPSSRSSVPALMQATVEPTRLDSLIHELLDTLRPHLDGRTIEADLVPGVRTTVPREALELLFVSMVLLVHEVAEGPHLGVFTETRPDELVAVRVEAGPAVEGPNELAVAECDNVARMIGADLKIEQAVDGLRVEATLSIDRVVVKRRGTVAIRVDDARIERMLVEQLRSLGWDAMVARAGDCLDGEVVGCVVAEGQEHLASSDVERDSELWVITLAPRRDGWRRRNELPLPFELDELRNLLDDPRGLGSVHVDE